MPQKLLLRFGLLTICTISVAAASEAYQLSGGPLHSPLTAVAFSTTLLAAVTALALTLAPTRALERLTESAARADAWIRQASILEWRVGALLLAAMATGTFLFIATWRASQQTAYGTNDQAAYMELAREVRTQGGPLATIQRLYQGTYTEANRHPLYPMVLSITDGFDAGKQLSIGLGLITIAVLTWMVARRFCWLVAGLFSVALATNGAFCRVATLVTCEMLLLLFSAAAWLVLLPKRSDFSDGARDLAEADKVRFFPSYFQTFCAGMLLGLAFMTKGTGLFLFVGMLAWIGVQWVGRRRSLKSTATHTLVAITAFVLFASPLLTRNVRRYETPLYNVNSHLLFRDEFTSPTELSTRQTVSKTALDYFATHSIGQMAARELRGLAWESFTFVRMFGPVPLDDSRVLFGIIMLGFAIMGWRNANFHQTLLIMWLGIFILFFSWYVPIVAGDRFLVPLLVPLLVLACHGIATVSQQLAREQWRVILLCTAAAWCALWVVATYLTTA